MNTWEKTWIQPPKTMWDEETWFGLCSPINLRLVLYLLESSEESLGSPEQAITLLTKLEKRNLQPDPRICLGSSLGDPFQLMSCDP